MAGLQLTWPKINQKCSQIADIGISPLLGNLALGIERRCQNFKHKLVIYVHSQ